MLGKDIQIGDYLGIRLASNPVGAMRWGILKKITPDELQLNLRFIGDKRVTDIVNINITDIACIETNNLFIHAMKLLDQNHVAAKWHQPEIVTDADGVQDESGHVLSFLDENQNSQAMGFLCDMDAGAVKVQRLDEYGREDGISILSRKVARHFRLNGDEEQGVEILYLANR